MIPLEIEHKSKKDEEEKKRFFFIVQPLIETDCEHFSKSGQTLNWTRDEKEREEGKQFQNACRRLLKRYEMEKRAFLRDVL